MLRFVQLGHNRVSQVVGATPMVALGLHLSVCREGRGRSLVYAVALVGYPDGAVEVLV